MREKKSDNVGYGRKRIELIYSGVSGDEIWSAIFFVVDFYSFLSTYSTVLSPDIDTIKYLIQCSFVALSIFSSCNNVVFDLCYG